MNQDKIESIFRRALKHLYYYGDIELVRYSMFELDRVYQDLLRVNYEIKFCKNSVDNSKEYWKLPIK